MSRDDLAAKHMGLVHACCRRYRDKGIEYDELFAAGCLGLSKALNGFDESRGCQFSTYAFPVITGEIKRLFRDGGCVRVSRSLYELRQKIDRLNGDFNSKNGKDMTVSQLAKELDESVERVTQAIVSAQGTLSLSGDGGEPDTELPAPDIQEAITEKLSLKSALGELEARDRELVKLRYYRGLTQQKTAEAMGMTQVQVSRREKKILALLRERLSA